MTPVCSFPDCGKRLHMKALRLCTGHYSQLQRGSELSPLRPRNQNQGKACSVTGCERDARAKGMCGSHWRHVQRYGEAREIQKISPRGSGAINPVSGYRFVTVPEGNPYYTAGKRVQEHRLVMAAVVGRTLLDDENVHHKNGDRIDNRPENLELWCTSQPCGQRVEDKVSWARDILARYDPGSLATGVRAELMPFSQN